jgi:NADH-quinone oxidoreductase subunit N
MMLALLGMAYKIAAAPMHFYAADVYEGAASPVTAFLGFVPKTAGMIAFMLLLQTIGWHDSGPALPQPIMTMLFMIAVLTMTLGNIGALLQTSAKRMLAYSSIAHSGYMIIGVIAGPGFGFNAVLLYLLHLRRDEHRRLRRARRA